MHIKTVISGSYRKHLAQLFKLREALLEAGFEVLSPIGSIAINPKEEFVILNDDIINDPRTLQDSIFAKIRMSTFLTLGNFDNYIGNAAILEIGYAISYGIKIYSIVQVNDPNLKPYINTIDEILPGINYK